MCEALTAENLGAGPPGVGLTANAWQALAVAGGGALAASTGLLATVAASWRCRTCAWTDRVDEASSDLS